MYDRWTTKLLPSLIWAILLNEKLKHRPRPIGKIHSYKSPTPPLIFTGPISTKFGFSFRRQVAFEAFWSRNVAAAYQKSETWLCGGSVQGGPKNGTVFWYALTSSNINRLSKLVHCQNQEKFIILLSLKIPPHLKCVATLPCEMSSVFKATIENKKTSVTTRF